MLINCPECGKEVSDKSKNCIHCGYPFTQYKVEPKKVKKEINTYTGIRVFCGICLVGLAMMLKFNVIDNMLAESEDFLRSGISLMLLWLSGIFGLCTCKSKSHILCIIPAFGVFLAHLFMKPTTMITILAMVIGIIYATLEYKIKNQNK